MTAKKSSTAATAKKRKITLALQSGAAHGAFTWGVLDRLLEEENLHIEGICASGIGAMNAAVVVSAVAKGGGITKGGRAKARRKLEDFWYKVSQVAGMLPFQPTPLDRMLGTMQLQFSPSLAALDFITHIFSPYQFNLFDFNPFRDVVDEMVDFKAIARQKEIQLFVNATHVVSGKPRLFAQEDVTLDVVVASSCLPYLFRAVEIDGEAYWDGGYSGNPPLSPLVYQCKSQDLLIVRSAGNESSDIPVKAPDILDRATEISFHRTLVEEIRRIELINRLLQEGCLKSKEYRPIYLHSIQAGDLLDTLGRASKLNAEWGFLTYLRDLGQQAAEDWLSGATTSLGRASTLDVQGL